MSDYGSMVAEQGSVRSEDGEKEEVFEEGEDFEEEEDFEDGMDLEDDDEEAYWEDDPAFEHKVTLDPVEKEEAKLEETKSELSRHFENKRGTSHGSGTATQRLIADLAYFSQLPADLGKDSVEIKDDDLYHWIVQMRDFPHDPRDSREETKIWRDLQTLKQQKKGQDYVELEILFPDDYPFAPPFIRVVCPRFQFHTGHITIGGSICMQVLTRSGWVPSYALETLLVQIKAEIISGGAKLDLANTTPYSVGEARQAFDRTANRYGWT